MNIKFKNNQQNQIKLNYIDVVKVNCLNTKI